MSKSKKLTEKHIEIGLQWDEMEGKTIDLDLQCVLMNELGQVEDAVYFNQPESKIAKIAHSGDSKGEKSGFDEILKLNLDSCPFQVKYIAILVCAYQGDPVSSVESGMLRILPGQNHVIEENQAKQINVHNDTVIYELALGALKQKGYSVLACIFEKSFEGKWQVFETEEVGEGKTFAECEALIKKGLVNSAGFDELLFQECKSWNGGKSFKLTKNQSLLIPPVLTKIAFGLGWDSNCDIDASVLLFDKEAVCVDNVYYGNKQSRDGSVVHSGDNLTGIGDGDDEVISIDLSQISKRIQTIWAVITIYTTNTQFDDVTGAYCRLFCMPNNSNKALSGNEFCRYNLSDNMDNISNGNIMCSITRCQEGQWVVAPKGFFTANTKTSNQISPIISQVLQNDFSKVKTLDQIFAEKPELARLAAQRAEQAAKESAAKEEKKRQEQQIIQEQLRLRELLAPRHIEVQVVSASGLGSFDSNGLSDPYAVVFLNKKKLGKTPVVRESLNPKWGQSFNCRIAQGDSLKIEIWDHDTFFDDFMGACFHTFEQPVVTSYLALNVLDKQGKQHPKYVGNVSIKLTQLV